MTGRAPARHSTPVLLVFSLGAAGALAVGCSTIYSRGLVEDLRGDPVAGADVRLLYAENASQVSARRADANGCFFFNLRAPRDRRHFTLEIGAAALKPARLDVPLQPPVLIATLAAASEEASSAIRPASLRERSEKWEPRCIPVYPPGAQQLAPSP